MVHWIGCEYASLTETSKGSATAPHRNMAVGRREGGSDAQVPVGAHDGHVSSPVNADSFRREGREGEGQQVVRCRIHYQGDTKILPWTLSR